MFEVRVTIPKQLLDAKAFENALEKGIARLVNDSAQEIRNLTDSWAPDDRPIITREDARKRGDAITGAMSAFGEALSDVSYGTSPHTITARNVSLLRFHHGSGYVRRTRPGILKPVGSGANTGNIIFKKSVRHPGIGHPRRWDMAIAAKYAPRLADVCVEAIRVARTVSSTPRS